MYQGNKKIGSYQNRQFLRASDILLIGILPKDKARKIISFLNLFNIYRFHIIYRSNSVYLFRLSLSERLCIRFSTIVSRRRRRRRGRPWIVGNAKTSRVAKKERSEGKLGVGEGELATAIGCCSRFLPLQWEA
jgi:hypothetical protein